MVFIYPEVFNFGETMVFLLNDFPGAGAYHLPVMFDQFDVVVVEGGFDEPLGFFAIVVQMG